MYLKNAELNHDEEHIHRVLGITDTQRTLFRERIFFACINQTLQTAELFADIDDAPANMSTLTAHLKAILKEIDDQLEYEYALLNFFTYGKMAISTARKFLETKSEDISREDKIKMGIISLIEKMRHQDDDEEDDEPTIDKLNEQTMLKRVTFVKQHANNFEAYFKSLQRWSGSTSGNSFDVDDLLNGILK